VWRADQVRPGIGSSIKTKFEIRSGPPVLALRSYRLGLDCRRYEAELESDFPSRKSQVCFGSGQKMRHTRKIVGNPRMLASAFHSK
jgi:hypothetical protein